MNAFVVSLLASVGAGIIAAVNATQHANGSTFSRFCFAVVGGLVGAGIYGSTGWVAIKLVASGPAPRVSVRTTGVGLAGLALVLSSPFITWFPVTAVVSVLVRSLGG